MNLKHLLLIASAIIVAATIAGAAEAAPALLCDQPPTPVVASQDGPACPPPPPAASCPPPPPVCEPPPPVCPPPPPVCATPPAPATVYEVVAVPVKRKVVEEECYVENVRRTQVVNEVRTRTAYKSVPVFVPKEVSAIKIAKVESRSGNAPRLARTTRRMVVPVEVKKKEAYEETYIVPVRESYTEPVVKTRKVTRYVDDVKMVNRPMRTLGQ